MAEVRFTREEIEEIIKEKFKVHKIQWDGDDLIVDMDIEELEKHNENKNNESKEETNDTYEDITDLNKEVPLNE